jgi:hypothetical protein
MSVDFVDTGPDTGNTGKHPPFTGVWQAESADARTALARIWAEVLAYEERQRTDAAAGGKPRRRRASAAQARFETAVRGIVCEGVDAVLSGNESGFRCPRSKSILERADRSRSPAINPLLPQALDVLASLDWIEQEIGRITFGGERHQTVVRPGRRLVELIAACDLTHDDFIREELGDEIVLRAEKSPGEGRGATINYADDGETRRMRAEMREINAHLRYADITLLPTPGRDGQFAANVDKRKLRRIFSNGSFASGGRLYGGFWLEDLKSDERMACIQIDRQPVVELDFAQCALRILYGLVEAVPPSGDLYAVPSLAQAQREDIKTMVSALTFVGDARLHELAPLARKICPHINAPIDSDREGMADAAALREAINRLKTYHARIAAFLPSEVGYQVQRIESDILVELLLTLNANGITVLPVHDSLVVRHDRANEAQAVMERVFERHTGVPAVVRSKSS